jgi:hypothetical protein
MKETVTALYIRLSNEDDNAGESDSVKNQRDLLTDFALSHPELSKSKLLYFIDDGYSGTNFERPAVKDMLERTKKGEIQYIAVKDFSRFGRNYIEVGGYLEQIFPFLGVKFLSVNDRFDSGDLIGGAAGISMGFKTIMHQMYSADLSVKSTSGKLTKTKRGEHVNGTAPFGYVKSKAVKNAWVTDEPAAATIRRIFEFALQGLSVCEIAKQLNAEGIPAPLAYRFANNTEKGVCCRRVDGTPLWRMANVTKIVRDERYTGKLITGQKKRVTVGGRKTAPVPKSEWITVPNAHEPIISQETFDEVQEILGGYNGRTIKKVNKTLLAGKVFCGHCKHALRYYRGLNPRYVCISNREKQGEPCFSDMVYEASLKEILLEAVNHQIAAAAAGKKEADRNNKTLYVKREKLSEQIKRLHADVQREKNNRTALFEDYSTGKLTEEQYVLKKAEKTNAITAKETEIIRLSDELQSQTNQGGSEYGKIGTVRAYTEVTPELLALVSGIYVYDSTRVEIKYNFSDPYKQL